MKKASTLLWYKKPARAWTQALPIGSGSLGAMVFGKPGKEVISLNYDELWSGPPPKREVKPSYKSFKKARQLAMEGELCKAQDIIEKECMGDWTQAYMPMGDLILDFEDKSKPDSYQRSLDLSQALARVEYTRGEKTFKREAFASHPAKLIAIKLMAENNATLDFSISFKDQLRVDYEISDGLLLSHGECLSHYVRRKDYSFDVGYKSEDEERGIRFLRAARVDTDGQKTFGRKKIHIRKATQAIIYITCESSFNGWDKLPFTQGKEYIKPCLDRIQADLDYDRLKREHVSDHKSFYDRVELDLGASRGHDLPTDERLLTFQKTKDDQALYTLLFNFGRYLKIASSRPGTQPSNLQGIWNHHLRPPWNANYTVNINTEMNYWPVLMCDMAELHQPLIEMIRDISVAGRKTARNYYNAPGFVSHHNIDLWRHTEPVKEGTVWSFWPMSSGWLCRHLYEHYEYSLDEDFLRETAEPIMKAAAEFYLAVLIEDPEGYLIFAPSTSPENTFKFQGRRCALSQTATMTMAIIADLFDNYLKACEILAIENDFTKDLTQARERLLPFKIGSKGQLLEWYEELPEAEPHHRHVSHLYALHPANLIDAEKTPELAEACKRTLELRGDDGTGWSLGWKINFWARLRDGNHALELLNKQLRFVRSTSFKYRGGGGTYANLFDAHPPFQIDGNFGAVSGIVEMLMFSTDEAITLLPALPDKWQKGSIKGIRAKGNIKLDLVWVKGLLTEYALEGVGEVKVRYKGKTKTHVLDGSKQRFSANL